MTKLTIFAAFLGYIISSIEAYLALVGSRNDQYCEMMWGSETTNLTVVGNYSSCTKHPGFYDLTVEDIQAVHGEENAAIVVWNGIREWMVDSWESEDGENPWETRTKYTYGNMFPDGTGFDMYEVATFDYSAEKYVEFYSERFSTAVYKAGSRIYELVAKDCVEIYVMQSFNIGRPGEFSGLTEESQLLPANLVRKLDLPRGWVYRTRVLESDLLIYGVNGTSIVLHDDLDNMYSGMDYPLNDELCNIKSSQTIQDAELPEKELIMNVTLDSEYALA